MAISITLNTANVAPNNGPISVTYTGSNSGAGNGAGWPSLTMLQLDINQNACLTEEYGVLLVFMAWWMARSATLSNTGVAVGHKMTVDLSANNAITVQ